MPTSSYPLAGCNMPGMTDAGPGLNDGVRVAQLPAVVDVADAMDLRAELAELLTNGTAVLVADLGATNMLSLEGLQALVLVRAAAARRGSQLRLGSLRPPVRVKMELTGTVRLFSLYDTVEQACAG